MVDSASLAYSYRGDLQQLKGAVKKACAEMKLEVRDEQHSADGFSLIAAEKTNWLSTNWPIKFIVKAEQVNDTYALVIQGSSSIGSLTQSANNHAKAQGLLSLIAVYAPNP